MNIKTILITVLLSLTTNNAVAMARLYAVVGAGYSDIEMNDINETDLGYRVVLGHQFHRQWHVEAGYYSLIDSKALEQDTESSVSADAIYLGVNGKAVGAAGELYYRLGVASVSLEHSFSDSAEQCGGADQNSCRYNDDIFAGIIGLGFDYSVTTHTFVRFEAEYLRGQESFDASIFSMGIRYNF